MRKCAKCHKEYDDAYDACPHCAKTAAWVSVAQGLLVIGALIYFWPLIAVMLRDLFGR